jgi:hypothetical protein
MNETGHKLVIRRYFSPDYVVDNLTVATKNAVATQFSLHWLQTSFY